MAKAVKYKRPRKINPISVSLALLAALLIYLGYQYIPLKLRKGEAYRVLDETASKFSGRKARYYEDEDSLVMLKVELASNLRLVGIRDPKMEHWIEIDSLYQVRFGVVYSEFITWPFDIIETQERVEELEYTLKIKR